MAQIKQNKDSKQIAWESWFIMSITATLGLFFICCLDGSRAIWELPWFLGISIINLFFCLRAGFKPRD